ncbi:protein-L-isoaspartate(D-aspartate) O-methyltransferase [Balneolales bacterium ANBcel1]|nr:protein-L-isoaspartate(D-aspartate) O-methyltransferase [Balneolales bacterium ANBcel1]
MSTVLSPDRTTRVDNSQCVRQRPECAFVDKGVISHGGSVRNNPDALSGGHRSSCHTQPGVARQNLALVTVFMVWMAVLVSGMAKGSHGMSDNDRYSEQRERMVERQIAARGIEHPLTLDAMRGVPRHLFVPAGQERRAYQDSPQPIGHGQTISQPYIVALMTELIQPWPDMKVLEIGTGSGYQAAVLAEFSDNVYTIEIIEELGRWGEGNLQKAGYDNVHTKIADGYHGWEEHAPFDAIVVTAAADHIPPPLVDQLRNGGRMIIPVGSPFRTQNLMLVQKDGDDIRTSNVMPVRFVPFTRDDD